MSANPAPLSKADRIAIGGAVAPVVRRQAEAPRVVTVVGKDGKPVRKTTSAEVAKAVLARSEIEFSVQEGKRPEWVACKTCGAPIKVSRYGKPRTVCRPGAHKCQCGNPVRINACGFGHLCKDCSALKSAGRLAAISPLARSEQARKNALKQWAKIDAKERRQRAIARSLAVPQEVRREAARKGGNAIASRRTPEQLAEQCSRMRSARRPTTHEERSEAARRARASMTPEERSAAAKKAHSSMTPEQRAERARKIRATYAARKAPPRHCACGAQLDRPSSKQCRRCWDQRKPT